MPRETAKLDIAMPSPPRDGQLREVRVVGGLGGTPERLRTKTQHEEGFLRLLEERRDREPARRQKSRRTRDCKHPRHPDSLPPRVLARSDHLVHVLPTPGHPSHACMSSRRELGKQRRTTTNSANSSSTGSAPTAATQLFHILERALRETPARSSNGPGGLPVSSTSCCEKRA